MLDMTVQICDIAKGEYPPEDGWYYIAVKDVLDGEWRLNKAYWRSDKKCWQYDPETHSTLFTPISYWGDIWMSKDIEKGFQELWGKK